MYVCVGLTGGLMFIAFLIDIVIFLKARSISFGTDEDDEEGGGPTLSVPLNEINQKNGNAGADPAPAHLLHQDKFRELKFIDEEDAIDDDDEVDIRRPLRN
jgi:hypothetical protein